MSFYLYDIPLFIIFTALISLFLYKRRRKLQKEGWLFLYRTKVGIKIINSFSRKNEKFLRIARYFVVFFGYALMIAMIYMFYSLIRLFSIPEVVRAVKIPPIFPLVPYIPELFGVDFLPPFYFTYWIIAIAITAVIHEFSHGIFASIEKIKIKTTGFAFLGPFIGAFVEPDEKQMKKKKIFSQLSVLSAGSFSNLVLTIFFLILLILFFKISYVPAGAIFNDYSYSIINFSDISKINNINVGNNVTALLDQKNISTIKVKNKTYLIDYESFVNQLKNIEKNNGKIMVYDDMPSIRYGLRGAIFEINSIKIKEINDLSKEIEKYKPGDEIKIKTKDSKGIHEYNFKIAESKDNKPAIGIVSLKMTGRGVFGFIYKLINMFKKDSTYYEPRIDGFVVFIYNLIWWLALINFSVALVNMLPVGIFDGGRVFYLTMLALTKSEEKAKKIFSFVTILLLILLFVIMFLWIYSYF